MFYDFRWQGPSFRWFAIPVHIDGHEIITFCRGKRVSGPFRFTRGPQSSCHGVSYQGRYKADANEFWHIQNFAGTRRVNLIIYDGKRSENFGQHKAFSFTFCWLKENKTFILGAPLS